MKLDPVEVNLRVVNVEQWKAVATQVVVVAGLWCDLAEATAKLADAMGAAAGDD